MSDYKVNINVSYYYGGWYIAFSKTFVFPFAPFYDMEIDEEDNTTELKNNDYCRTIISFNPKTIEFDIYNRNSWFHPVTDETVDTIIEQFGNTGWERIDKTDATKLKELMLRDYNNKKNFKFSE